MAKVDNANKALSYLGEDTITSFSDETEPARLINIHYDACRRYLLSQHNWWFATVRTSLVASTGHSDEKYPYSYEYPNNCIKMLRTDCDTEKWQRFGDQIWSESNTFTCEYIADVSESKFSPAFEEALIYYLASKIAMTVTGDRGIKSDAFQMYQQTIAQAISANDLEQGIQTLYEEESLSGRNGFRGLGGFSAS